MSKTWGRGVVLSSHTENWRLPFWFPLKSPQRVWATWIPSCPYFPATFAKLWATSGLSGWEKVATQKRDTRPIHPGGGPPAPAWTARSAATATRRRPAEPPRDAPCRRRQTCPPKRKINVESPYLVDVGRGAKVSKV